MKKDNPASYHLLRKRS